MTAWSGWFNESEGFSLELLWWLHASVQTHTVQVVLILLLQPHSVLQATWLLRWILSAFLGFGSPSDITNKEMQASVLGAGKEEEKGRRSLSGLPVGSMEQGVVAHDGCDYRLCIASGNSPIFMSYLKAPPLQCRLAHSWPQPDYCLPVPVKPVAGYFIWW